MGCHGMSWEVCLSEGSKKAMLAKMLQGFGTPGEDLQHGESATCAPGIHRSYRLGWQVCIRPLPFGFREPGLLGHAS